MLEKACAKQPFLSVQHYFRSYVSIVEVGQLERQTGDGQLDVGPGPVQDRDGAQHPSDLFVALSPSASRGIAAALGRLTHDVDALLGDQ